MRRAQVGFGVLAAVTMLAASAHAQVTSERMTEGRQPRSVKFVVQARVDHDTNVPRVSAANALLLRVEREDTIYTPTAKVDALIPVGRQAVFLQASAGYLFHQRNPRLDTSNIDATGGLGNVFGPCGSIVAGSYRRGRSELDDRVLVATVQNILEVKSVRADLTCVRPPGLGLNLSASRDLASNSSTLVGTSDYTTSSATAAVFYGRPSVGKIFLQANYGKTDYKTRVVIPGNAEGFESVGVGLRLERKLGARIEAVAETSYTKVNVSKVPGGVGPVQLVDNFRGLTYKGEVTVKASSRLLGKASVRREIVPTILQGRGYEIQTTYGGGLTYRIGTRLALDLAGEEQRKNIREGLAPVPLNSITDSRLRTGSAALRYKQSARLSFTLNGQLEERKADDPQFNYTSERVGLSADLSF